MFCWLIFLEILPNCIIHQFSPTLFQYRLKYLVWQKYWWNCFNCQVETVWWISRFNIINFFKIHGIVISRELLLRWLVLINVEMSLSDNIIGKYYHTCNYFVWPDTSNGLSATFSNVLTEADNWARLIYSYNWDLFKKI